MAHADPNSDPMEQRCPACAAGQPCLQCHDGNTAGANKFTAAGTIYDKLALSSGAARNPNDPGFQDPGGYWKDYNPYGAPAGYPKESPSCPGVITPLCFLTHLLSSVCFS